MKELHKIKPGNWNKFLSSAIKKRNERSACGQDDRNNRYSSFDVGPVSANLVPKQISSAWHVRRASASRVTSRLPRIIPFLYQPTFGKSCCSHEWIYGTPFIVMQIRAAPKIHQIVPGTSLQHDCLLLCPHLPRKGTIVSRKQLTRQFFCAGFRERKKSFMMKQRPSSWR